ncbi:response regulator transcription factor [Methyloraptor flagellatus]|uniref:Response regulator n=1 Tax=Methyloraptor flagellatus TaxID=3162530 RepID=A0AAU7X7Q0_9HYPH
MSEIEPIVHIVDDDPDVRDSVNFLVSSLGYRCVTSASAQDFLRALDDQRPCCAVLDVRLPGLSGLELQNELQRRGSAVRVIFITGHGDVPKAVRAMRHGAIDFLEKPFDDQVLLDRIGEALAESREAIERRRRQGDLERRLSSLTDREREVLAHIVAGRTNKAIAAALDISVKTVENHRHNLMSKAGVTSVAQLIAWASEPGQISA